MPLTRLPLSVLRPGEPAGAATEPAAAAAGRAGDAAALTRHNLRLVLATRLHVSKLIAVEAALLGAAVPSGRERPSVLRGSIIRFVSKGKYRLDWVAGTKLDESGELVLSLQVFGKPVPIICLSSTSSLDDDRLFEEQGRGELAALVAAMAQSGAAPTCCELAATCCRLSLGWLWAAELEVLRVALHWDAAAVAALLDDQAAVAALLPCFQGSADAAAAAAEASLAAAARTSLAAGSQPQAPAEGKPSTGAGATPARGDGRAGIAPATDAGQQQQQQQQQLHEQQDQAQQDRGPPPPAAKRQRTSSAARGSPTTALQLEPGELPPEKQQQQQAQQRQQAAQQQQPGTAAGQWQQKVAASPQSQAKPQPGAAAVKSPSPQQQQQQEPLPGNVMPPGGPLESLLVEAVGLCDMQHPGQLRQIGDLGNLLVKLNRNWRKLVPSGCGLGKLILELQRRGLVQAKMRDGNLFVRLPPPAAPPPGLVPPPLPPPPMFAPYYASIPPAYLPNAHFAFRFPG
ncbi:hypothetical protein ABPG75_009611 [Micractinium tetrahymenae]